jgi:hypothetical protein
MNNAGQGTKKNNGCNTPGEIGETKGIGFRKNIGEGGFIIGIRYFYLYLQLERCK